MTRRPPVLVLAAGLGLAALAGLAGERLALAQPSTEARAAAAALFEDGRRLMADGKYAEACPKLQESQRIDPGMGTLYQVSVCYEAIGRTASAWVGFRDVASQAAAAGQSDREKAARGKATAIEPKLMRLKISVQPVNVGAGVEVKRDGAVVSPALWGTPVPLDPGRHRISAIAPGKEPWEVTVQLDQPGNLINVDVPPLLERKPGSGAATPPSGPLADRPPAGPQGPQGPGTPPPVESGSPRPWQMPLGIAATVVGAGGLAGGIALGVMAKSTFDSSNSGTPPNCDKTTNKCNPQGLVQRSDAVNKGNIATGVFVAGAVLAAGGIVIWITAPSSHAASTGATPVTMGETPKPPALPAPQVGLSPTGLSLRGAW